MSDELRPCLVNEKKALFHRWITEDQMFTKFFTRLRDGELEKQKIDIETNHVVPVQNDIEKITNTYALVEFEDGAIEKVKPEDVRFLDSGNKFQEYCFELYKKPKILYVCNGESCESCYNDLCHLTSNIEHAKNFEKDESGNYVENLPQEEISE